MKNCAVWPRTEWRMKPRKCWGFPHAPPSITGRTPEPGSIAKSKLRRTEANVTLQLTDGSPYLSTVLTRKTQATWLASRLQRRQRGNGRLNPERREQWRVSDPVVTPALPRALPWESRHTSPYQYADAP